ncbi:hypothetical protein [Devosia sp. XK-2]|uniref:hypothetical protein n=1 Tax=Devosia sp. XK-2 TaxID=3126689 RepID=UPI0030D349E6
MHATKNPRFWILAGAASVLTMLVFLLLPSSVRLPLPSNVQVLLSIGAGFALARAYLKRFPNRPMTVRAAAGVIPFWAYCAFCGLVLWSGMDQGLHPLQVVGTVLGAMFLVIVMPWLFWLLVKDAVAAVLRLLGR